MSDWFTATIQVPEKPEMDPIASREWDRIVKFLLAINRTTDLDGQSLAEYCLTYSQMISIVKKIGDEDLAQPGKNCEVEHPLINPLLKTVDTLLTHCVAFGMTPKTRDLTRTSNNWKPAEVKALHGNPGKRDLVRDPMLQIEFEDDSHMQPPDWLSSRAANHYRTAANTLAASNMFTPMDMVALTAVSMLHDLCVKAYEQRRRMYTDVYNKDGDVVEQRAHPILTTATKLSTKADYLRRHFGMAPKYRKIASGQDLSEEGRKKRVPLVFGE